MSANMTSATTIIRANDLLVTLAVSLLGLGLSAALLPRFSAEIATVLSYMG